MADSIPFCGRRLKRVTLPPAAVIIAVIAAIAGIAAISAIVRAAVIPASPAVPAVSRSYDNPGPYTVGG